MPSRRATAGRSSLWSDDTTRSYGTISARGGAASGNGGFVETSGKLGLDVTRGPDVRAPNGQGGTWLLDPNDLIVDVGSSLVNNNGQPQFFTLGESSVIGVDLINLQLDGGSNVFLTTTSAGATAGTQQGNITIRAPIIKRASSTPTRSIGTTTFTATAHNNIIIEGAGGIAATANTGPLGTLVDADPLNVILTANLDNVGGGGVTVGGTGIITQGGGVQISGQNVVVNSPIIATRQNASPGSVFLNQILFPSSVPSTGPVTVNAPIVGGFFRALAGGPLSGGAGSLLTLAGSVTATGAVLLADDMEITGLVNAGSGGLTVAPPTAGRAINLGGAVGGALSLTPAELANLVTSGPVQYGGVVPAGGPVTVSSPITLGSSSVTIIGTAFNVNPGASLTTVVPLAISAPTVTIGGSVSGQSVTFNGMSSMAVNAPVVSGGNIDIFATGAVDLGGGAAAFQLDNAELANLTNAVTGHLRINGGAMMVQGPISRTGRGALFLSGSTLGQAAGATITADGLRADFSGAINLPEANAVSNFAASAGSMTFSNAPLLTIGSVAGRNGVSGANPMSILTFMVDDFDAVSTITAPVVNITPRTAGRPLNLGGAFASGQLNISATDLLNTRGTDGESQRRHREHRRTCKRLPRNYRAVYRTGHRYHSDQYRGRGWSQLYPGANRQRNGEQLHARQ